MNKEEKKVIEASIELWNAFLKLEKYHPDDIHDVRFHIHAIQSIIMRRECIRNTPSLFHPINRDYQEKPISTSGKRPRPEVEDNHTA